MDNNTWSRLEGMIIAKELDPHAVADYLADQQIVAELEWYPATPHMVGISVASDDEHVATLKSVKTGVTPGPTLIEFVEALAEKLSAEVMIGDMGVDRLPEGVEIPADEVEASTDPLRVVEISSTPASAVPLMAAFEGVDVADIDLPEGKRALVAELPANRSGWYFADAPLVALTRHGDEFQAFLVEDQDPENVVTFNWAMDQILVPGAAGDSEDAIALAEDLVGSKEELLRIHDGVPGEDGEAAWESTKLKGAEAVRKFVTALGLPDDLIGFLLGTLSTTEIENARIHEARGVSNAIGRSVNIMLDEKESTSEAWGRYSEKLANNPWQVPITSGIEAAIGTTLIVLTRGRGQKRSWLKRLGLSAGVLLLVDSVAELALSRYVSARNSRKQARSAGDFQAPGIRD